MKRLAFFLLLLLPAFASANTELDRKYALETVGFLKAWDNVDGLFTEYVSSAYKDYFSRQSRFVLQDLSQADAVLSRSNIPYRKLIDDPEILGQIARSTRSQTIIRTKVIKEGPQYRFTIEWLHAPAMDLLSKETLLLTDPRDGKGFSGPELKAQIQLTLDKAIRKVPFMGTVTGRDNNSVTLNIGSMSGLLPGDQLVIGTLEEVKRHPLLKEIVEWRFAQTGKVQIEQVEERIAFAKVVDEEPGREIARQQKVINIIHRPEAREIPVTQDAEEQASLDEPPRLGWVSGGLAFGGFSRDYSTLDNTIGKSGGGFLFGVKTDSQIWLTREWFGEMGLDFGFWPYSQHDTLPGSSSASANIGSGSLVGFKLAAGYSYLISGDLFGPKGWLKLGYRSQAYSLPASSTDASASISFKSLFVGLGTDLPLRSGFGAFLDLGFGLLNSVNEDSRLSGDADSASDVSFSVGGYYRYMPRITFKATLDARIDSADFKNGRSTSEKAITFVPAILYYF